MPHALLGVFGVLVTAILDAVPGWSAPLRVWMTLAAFVFAALAAHAAARGIASTCRRRWRGAALALLLAAMLAIAAAAMFKLGLRLGAAGYGDAFDDARPAVVEERK